MLSSLLPTDKQLALIQQIGADLDESDGSRRLFKADIEQFLRSRRLSPIPAYKYSRFWSSGKGLDFRERIAVFDYISTEYRNRLRGRADETAVRHAKMIDSVLAEYDAMQGEQSPLNTIRTRAHQFEGAQPFLGSFLGYRVSSRKGEIVRFSLEIGLTRTNELTFKNIYDRDGVRWICSGGGLIHDSSLYLIGKAIDQKNTTLHRGYRMLCLEPWRGSKILQGVVISRDRLGPIAARFVAIPVNRHDLTPPRGRYGSLMTDSRFAKALSGKDWEAANTLVELDKLFLSQGDYNELEEIIDDQTLDAISTSDADAGQLSVWNFITNATSTTLHGYLNIKGIDAAHDDMDEFDALVVRLVERMQRSGASVRDMVHQSLKDLIDRDEPERAAGLIEASPKLRQASVNNSD